MRGRIIGVGILALAVSLAVAWAQKSPSTLSPPPVQPIPYSHKQHVAMGLKCTECHVMPGVGEMMTYPVTDKCMTCHTNVAKDKPAIQKLASFAASKQPIPWIPIYQIPDWVDFSHKTHLAAGAQCEQCHGPVAQREFLSKEGDLSMGACMDCHRQKNARTECDSCHDPK